MDALARLRELTQRVYSAECRFGDSLDFDETLERVMLPILAELAAAREDESIRAMYRWYGEEVGCDCADGSCVLCRVDAYLQKNTAARRATDAAMGER